MSSIWETLVTGFDAVVDFSNNGTMISDAVNSALFGAITTAIGGGDIGEGAAWGAAGGAIAHGDDGIFNIIGKGVSGYGIDKALDGDGLLGGAGGLLAGYLENESGVTRTTNNQSNTGNTGNPKAGGLNSNTLNKSSGGAQGLLEKYGLQTADGDGTLLGKTLVGAAAAYGQSEAVEDQIEKVAEIRDKSDRNKKLLDEEFQQRNLTGFRQPNMIVRNG